MELNVSDFGGGQSQPIHHIVVSYSTRGSQKKVELHICCSMSFTKHLCHKREDYYSAPESISLTANVFEIFLYIVDEYQVGFYCLQNTSQLTYNIYTLLIQMMQVSIKEGRHFWLNLKGTTVPLQSPMVYVPTGAD